MAPWCIHISCFERVARSGSGRGSVRGLVGAMDAELSRPDWPATVQSGRKQVQSRVCMPGFRLGLGERGLVVVRPYPSNNPKAKGPSLPVDEVVPPPPL